MIGRVRRAAIEFMSVLQPLRLLFDQMQFVLIVSDSDRW